MSIEARRPATGESLYPVVPQNSGSSGVICARVKAFDSRVRLRPATAVPLLGTTGAISGVFARIFAPGVAYIPPNHDPGDPSATAEANDIWFFSSIPNAQFGPSPGANNLLVVWMAFVDSSADERLSIPFCAVSAQQVECALGGGGSGPSCLPQQQVAMGVALTTAPAVWALLATGFELVKGVFNGPWLLALRSPEPDTVTWDNGGDGHRVPCVALRCEGPLATTWRLTFRNGAGEEVVYTRPATEWNPLGENVLFRTAGTGAPATLTVTPG